MNFMLFSDEKMANKAYRKNWSTVVFTLLRLDILMLQFKRNVVVIFVAKAYLGYLKVKPA